MLGYAVFTAGWMLIFLAPLLYYYASPRVEKAPYDVYDTTISDGTGSYFSVRSLSLVGPVPLRNVSVAKGDPGASTDAVAVIGIFSRTRDLTRGDFDFGYSVYAFDRSTGYAVNCCGAKPPQQGLTLKFPFHTKRITYQFWDSSARRAFPANYVRSDVIDGLDADVFVSHVPATLIRSVHVPGGIVGEPGVEDVRASRYYQATTTLWVEPFTGAILKVSQHSQQWLADDLGTRLLTLADVDLTNDAKSVLSVVNQVKPKLWQLRLFSFWLPIVGPILGALLLLGSWPLLRATGGSGAARRAAGAPGAVPTD
jgi:hypothetical protein